MLTRNFSVDEMTKTNTGLLNTPSAEDLEKLLYLCTYLLQPIRDEWGCIIVTSGLRKFQVNEKVGGSVGSQHLKGEAGDIRPQADIKKVFNWIMASDLKYGQLIYEKHGDIEWIHISLPRRGRPNMQNLSIIDGVRTVVTAPL